MVEILTANEVAGRLKVHLMTVYRWVSMGQLKANRLPGGGLRIEGTELEKLLCERSCTKRRRKADAKQSK